MFTHQEQELIREILADFFEKMTLFVEVKNTEFQEETANVDLSVESPQILIGEAGRTLVELQHILRLVLLKRLGKPIYLNLDVNDYRKKKDVWLRELARAAADEVALNHTEKELPAMTAQERRIVHLVLSERTDIVTESRGQEPERKVVIKPAPRF